VKYYGEEALGLIETLGMVPAIEAADQMLKAANVELVAYENIGSTLVTIMVKGDVGAVKASVEAGAVAAAAIGTLTAQNVMPRPIRDIGGVVSTYEIAEVEDALPKSKYRALGLVETFGIVFALEAADAMCKAADVELIGFENVASGYISVLVRGDVGACKAAVDTGVRAVVDMGAEVYSSVVIASPHQDLEKIIALYSLETLNP
jgi:carbon dioxide concentrating mechanism protein CcmO